MVTENIEKRVLNPLEVAQRLGVSRKTVYSMLKRKELPYIMAGDMYLVPISAFEKWLLECGNQRKASAGV